MFSIIFIFIKLKNLSASNFNRQKLEQAFHLEISVYSRSDKHLISKMEKPKVANFNWNFLVKACYSFLSVSFFPNCLFGRFSEEFSFHFISFLILHLKRWAVGSFQFWSNGPRLPSLSTLCLHPFCRRCVFPSPLSSGFFSVSFFFLPLFAGF